jgi:hypothetical protein
MEYCFGQSDRRVEADGFDPEFHHTSLAAANANTLMRHMNWILQTIKALPESLVVHMGPEMASFIILKRVSPNSVVRETKPDISTHVARNGVVKLNKSNRIRAEMPKIPPIPRSSTTFSAAHFPSPKKAPSA